MKRFIFLLSLFSLIGFMAWPVPISASPARQIELVNHIGGQAEAVFVKDNYAYVSFGPELAILDISNPSRPDRVGYTILPGQIEQIQVAGQYAYLITELDTFYAVNVSEPASPQIIGSYLLPDHANRIVVMSNYTYVATSPKWQGDQQVGGGVRIIDITTPAAPREVGFYEVAQTVSDVAIWSETADNSVKTYAYIAVREDIPRILDISDPTDPQAIDTEVVLPDYNSVAIDNGYAYLLGSDTLYIMALSSPTQPTEVGRYQTWGQVTGMTLAGSYIYLINGWGDSRYNILLGVDISNPTQPTKAGSYNIVGQALAMTASGDYVYVAAGYTGLLLVNVAEPAYPVEAGSYTSPTPVENISLWDHYGYTSVELGGREGFSVLNLTDPTSPLELSRYKLPVGLDSSNNAWNIQVTGAPSAGSGPPYGYIAQRSSTVEIFSSYYLQLLNTSNPATPLKLGVYRTMCSPAEGAAVAADPSGSGQLYAYLAAGLMGLRVVDVTDPLAPREVGAYFVPPTLTGVLEEELTFQDYTIRIYDNEEPEPISTLAILKNDALVYIQQEWGFYLLDLSNQEQPSPAGEKIMDITGNGIPDLVVQAYTGGAHCCAYTHIFELGDALRLIEVIETLDSDGRFEDLEDDQIPELLVHDWTFAYWETAFADSPAPQVILRYQAGAYQPALDLMRRPAPDPAALTEHAEEIQVDWEAEPQAGPPPALWTTMLDLIYSGQAGLAWPFFEQAWWPAAPGQEEFLADFLFQLSTSPYWPELYRLNQGQWPASFESALARAELPPLPTSSDMPASPGTLTLFSTPAISETLSEGQSNPQGAVETVFVQGSYAYAGIGSALVVLDISTPAQPRPVGAVELPGRVKDIYVDGDYAYLAKASDLVEGKMTPGGVSVVDISEPESPAVISFYETTGELDDLTLIEGYLYCVEQPGLSAGKLHVFDPSNPATLTEVAFYDVPQGPIKIDLIGASGDYIYLSAGEGGLFILQR